MYFRNVWCLVEVNFYSVTVLLTVGKPCGLFVRHLKKVMSYVVLLLFIVACDISYVNKGWHFTRFYRVFVLEYDAMHVAT